MSRVILASTSPARRALLATVGLAHEAEAPGVDEDVPPGLAPGDIARTLALRKAAAVAARHPDAIVIGADQVLDLDGAPFGKPADEAEALAGLRRLAGRAHALVTGLAVIAPGHPPVVEEERTVLHVRALSADEARRYVATGEWRGCAGGYRVEGRGLALFERIDGDWTNVQGLPVPRLLGHLRRLGVPIL